MFANWCRSQVAMIPALSHDRAYQQILIAPFAYDHYIYKQIPRFLLTDKPLQRNF
jgi:hypothetical protein